MNVDTFSAATGYTGKTHQSYPETDNMISQTASIVLQAVYSGVDSAITISVQQSMDKINWDNVRDDSGDAYTFSVGGGTARSGNFCIAFERIHAVYFRVRVLPGDATEGVVTLNYVTRVIKN